jgi:hypothetical protein
LWVGASAKAAKSFRSDSAIVVDEFYGGLIAMMATESQNSAAFLSPLR